jgi:hypothetical protein
VVPDKEGMGNMMTDKEKMVKDTMMMDKEGMDKMMTDKPMMDKKDMENVMPDKMSKEKMMVDKDDTMDQMAKERKEQLDTFDSGLMRKIKLSDRGGQSDSGSHEADRSSKSLPGFDSSGEKVQVKKSDFRLRTPEKWKSLKFKQCL